MARIRSIKPEFWSDYRLSTELTRDQRLFYVALWNQADDEGRFSAHPRRLLGACFPYEEDISAADVSGWLQCLSATGRVVLYEVDGEPYGALTKFAAHQRINRPTPSRLPPAPIRDESVNAPALTCDESVNAPAEITEDSIPHTRAPELEVGDGTGSKELGAGNREVGWEPRGGEEEQEGTTPAQARNDWEAAADSVIVALNRGMASNPLLERYEPVLPQHVSRSDVIEWLQAGWDVEELRRIAFEAGREFRPGGSQRTRQIFSMAYLKDSLAIAAARKAAEADVDPMGSGGPERGLARAAAPAGDRAAGVKGWAGIDPPGRETW